MAEQVTASDPTDPSGIKSWHDDTGSVITEYGLLAIVGATVASLVIKWAAGGPVVAGL